MPCLVKLPVTEEITADENKSIRGVHECLLVDEAMVAVWLTVLRVCLDNKHPGVVVLFSLYSVIPL